MQDYTPREYQTLITEFILGHPRCAVLAGMGMGKTVSTATALDALYLTELDPRDKVLVLAPLRVARSVWPLEFRKWRHLRDLTVMPIVGSEEERRSALRMDANVYTMNYENLPWLIHTLGDRWPFKVVVADEATRLKNYRGSFQVSKNGKEFIRGGGGQRARALAKVAHMKTERFIELTGTPAPNGLKDVWGWMWFLDGGESLGRTYEGFMERWFTKDFDGYGVKPHKFAEDQIHDRMRKLCITVDPADYFDLEKPIINNVYVELPFRAREKYRQLERTMFTTLGEHEIEAFGAAARTIKCLQFASGAAYVGEDNTKWADVHDEKLEALGEIVDSAQGAPLLVAYHFKSDMARILKRFPRARVLDQATKTIEDWNAGRIPMLLAHPASAGHGLNLQDGGNQIVFFSHWWNLEEYQQIIERIGPVRQAQAGHRRPVFIHHIIARGTVDEDVMLRRETKREVQDLLLDAMKRRQA